MYQPYQSWGSMPYSPNIYQMVQMQNERINELERQLMELRNGLNDVKKNGNGSHIERVEYKFDQLKIERLEGTLNIGLTPNTGDDTIDDFSVQQKGITVNSIANSHPEALQEIQQQIYQYLDHDCYGLIQSLEQKYQCPLDQQYRQFMVKDVKRQIDQRIHYYLNQ